VSSELTLGVYVNPRRCDEAKHEEAAFSSVRNHVEALPNNSLKLTRRAGPLGMLVMPAGLA